MIRKIAKKPFTLLDSILDRAFSVLGAAVFSQIPEFIQQYIQRLGGHVDEAQRQVDHIIQAARLSGKTVEGYIGKFIASQDPDFRRQGEMLQDTIERALELQDALEAVENASVLTKPFVFLAKMQYPIFRATLENFEPAVPLTLENLVYALAGLFFAMSVYRLSLNSPVWLVKKVKARSRTRRQRPTTA